MRGPLCWHCWYNMVSMNDDETIEAVYSSILIESSQKWVPWNARNGVSKTCLFSYRGNTRTAVRTGYAYFRRSLQKKYGDVATLTLNIASIDPNRSKPSSYSDSLGPSWRIPILVWLEIIHVLFPRRNKNTSFCIFHCWKTCFFKSLSWYL